MSGVLDKSDNTPRPQKGNNGSGYVIPTDGNGLPYSASNPMPVDIRQTEVTINAVISSEIEVKNDVGNPIPTRSGFVLASDGVYINPDDVAQVLNYTGTVLNYVEVVYGGFTYRQTLTYTTGNLTGVSQWTKQ
jgi:hypothetical protein